MTEKYKRMIEIFEIITPKFIRRKLVKILNLAMIEQRETQEAKTPKIKLEKQHIQNAKLLLNREELLERLPKSGVVAEIGVDEGNFSEMILRICNPSKLHLIDSWGTERFGDDKFDCVRQRFNDRLNSGLVKIHGKLSIDAAEDFKDELFDWIYIDTTHSYEFTRNELMKYENKVKKSGIIAGHDYREGNWTTGYKYGVIEAVHEFCVTRNWELIYLTTFNESPSFAIKRINNS